jgi:hypothetical protein
MSRTTVAVLAGSVLLLAPSSAYGQSRTTPGEMKSTSATIVSVEQAGRLLTFRDAKGDLRRSRSKGRRERLRTQTGRHGEREDYDITLAVKQPGDPTSTRFKGRGGAFRHDTRASGGSTAANHGHHRRHRHERAIDFVTGPDGWKFSATVQDKTALGR